MGKHSGQEIPATHHDFAAWRKRQAFANPDLAKHAEFVEADLRMLRTLGPYSIRTKALCLKNIAAFVEAYRASHRVSENT